MIFFTEQELDDIAYVLNEGLNEWGFVGDPEQERLGDSVEVILEKIKNHKERRRAY